MHGGEGVVEIRGGAAISSLGPRLATGGVTPTIRGATEVAMGASPPSPVLVQRARGDGATRTRASSSRSSGTVGVTDDGMHDGTATPAPGSVTGGRIQEGGVTTSSP